MSLKKIEQARKDYLMHYGVKGMKWGVRKAVKQNASKIGESSGSLSKRSVDRVVKSKHLKEASKLSEQELNEKIKRMDLERRYAQLKSDTDTSTKAMVSSVMSDVGGLVASTAVTVGVQALIFAILKGDSP